MPIYLTIGGDRKMTWNKKKSKVGSRRFRHRAARLVRNYCKSFPITVVVQRMKMNYQFAFKPLLVNGRGRNVLLYHKNVMVIMKFEDASSWIQTFITSNKMYDQPMFQMTV